MTARITWVLKTAIAEAECGVLSKTQITHSIVSYIKKLNGTMSVRLIQHSNLTGALDGKAEAKQTLHHHAVTSAILSRGRQRKHANVINYPTAVCLDW